MCQNTSVFNHEGQEARRTPLTLSKNGYQYLKANMLNEAIEAFKEILDIEPENHYALVGLGDCYRKTKNFDKAVKLYQDCLQYFPENNYALFGLADSYKALRRYHDAINVWERYYKHDDSNVTVLTRIAGVYRKVKNFDKALELYNKVLELEQNNPYALIGLGHLHYDFKRYSDSLTYWSKMDELQGDRVDIRVLTSTGNCYRKLRKFREGIPCFERALARQPENFYALFGLADCYRGVQEHEQALRYWRLLLKTNAHNKFILNRAADALVNLEQLDEAEILYHQALKEEFDVYSILGLAAISRKRGDPSAAVKTLEVLRKQNPQSHRVYLDLAFSYERKNMIKEAIEVLLDYLKQGYNRKSVSEYLDVLKKRAQFQ